MIPPIIRTFLGSLSEWLVGPVLCSKCFSDPGLQMAASKIGRNEHRRCRHCGAFDGSKLYRTAVEALMVEFFWHGSFFRADFGGAHRLVSNPYRYGSREVDFPSWLRSDAHLLEDELKVGLFHYGPPLWRIGEIEQLVNLRNPKTRSAAISSLFHQFPEKILVAGTPFFRVRKNLAPEQEQDFSQYDAPPQGYGGSGRLDSKGLTVLYGSEDLEICIHECRVIIPDECFVASLETTRDLRLLDLTAPPISDGATPFESLDISMRFLFSAGDHSYSITQAIARRARRAGYNGIVYPSYFSLVKLKSIPNIALFGRPIKSGAVRVKAINRAMLSSATYEVRMGPIFS